MVLITKNRTLQEEISKEQNRVQLEEVKEKLQQYLANNNSAKDKWLLSCHAHCFICLS